MTAPMLLDFLFGHTVTRDQLGYLGGHPDFRPPAPSVPAGHVDVRGVMVTEGDWAEYDSHQQIARFK